MCKKYEQDIHRLHTTSETEGTPECNHPLGEQIPYCIHWETVREISNGDEPSFILGYQQEALQYFMGFPGVFPIRESTQGTDASDWSDWDSGEQQLFI